MPALAVRGASLTFGERTLWSGVDLTLEPGEFVAVLGSNGSGKTTLLRAILGQQALSSGTIEVEGRPARRGDRRLGYIPQQRIIPPGTPLRGRDLVLLGLTGHRFGIPRTSAADRARVTAAIEAVGATAYADRPMGSLSGGEQQRLRIAQAMVSEPALLLADEPLSSLDLAHQRGIAELIDRQRREHDTAVLFVTHDINPVLGMVDRVLYLAQGRYTAGTPDDVLRSDVLSSLYGTPVEVFRRGDRVFVAGGVEEGHHL